MNVKIEKATTKDAKEILTLQKLVFKDVAELYSYCTTPPMSETVEKLKKEILNKVVFKAVLDGKIIGSIRGYRKSGTCYLEKISVHPSCQNQDVGTRLMERMEEHFKGRVERFQLSTVLESEKNVYLYNKKLGYNIYRKEKVSGDVTYVYMEKSA